ncbi:hypothetical protein D9M68_886850 [compost metagenome]
MAVLLVTRIVKTADAGTFEERCIVVGLEHARHFHPLRQLLQLAGCHHEGHLVEALEQFVLGRVRLVTDQFAVLIEILLIATVFFHFGHNRQLVGMLEVEQQVDGPTTAAHRHRLAANDGRE